MFCTEFEDHLTDYLDGSLDTATNKAFAEHALRCPVCHDLLNEVKNTLQACSIATTPPGPPIAELEARIMRATTPQFEMSCEEFENYLTDYLDGFLPAPLFHRWERHAALCSHCNELPGQVVRAIGVCYTYISIEKEVPEGLHQRILQSTIGTVRAREIKAPLVARIIESLRGLLDPIISPQFATVASMLLVAVMILTSMVSADGSISGMYRTTLKLAEQTYEQGMKYRIKGQPLIPKPENLPVNTLGPIENGKALEMQLKKDDEQSTDKKDQREESEKRQTNEQKK